MKNTHSMRFLAEDGGEGGGATSLLEGSSDNGGGAGEPQQQKQDGDGFAWTDPSGAFNKDWTSKLPETLKDAIPTLSKYRGVADLAQAYHSLQVLLGKKGNAIVPINEKSTPEEVAAFRKALGVPASASEYALKPDKLPDGVTWNDDNGKALAEMAHKHNIPAVAVKEIVSWMLEARAKQAADAVVEQQAEAALTHTKNVQALQQIWGKEFEKNISIATRAALTVGLDPKHPGLADPELVKALAKFGGIISEDKLVRGDGGGDAFGSPAAMAKDIRTNPDNPMYKRYQEGDPSVVDHVRSLQRRAA